MTNPENNQRPTLPIERFALALSRFREHPGRSFRDFLTLDDAQIAVMVGTAACISGYCSDEMTKIILRKADELPEL